MKYLKLLMFWNWFERYTCHGDLFPCQFVDDPNDNHSTYKEPDLPLYIVKYDVLCFNGIKAEWVANNKYEVFCLDVEDAVCGIKLMLLADKKIHEIKITEVVKG